MSLRAESYLFAAIAQPCAQAWQNAIGSQKRRIAQLSRQYLTSLQRAQYDPDRALTIIMRTMDALRQLAPHLPEEKIRRLALLPMKLEDRVLAAVKQNSDLRLFLDLHEPAYRPAQVLIAAHERLCLTFGNFDQRRYHRSFRFLDERLRLFPYGNGWNSAAPLVEALKQAKGDVETAASFLRGYMKRAAGSVYVRFFFRAAPLPEFPSAQADVIAAYFIARYR